MTSSGFEKCMLEDFLDGGMKLFASLIFVLDKSWVKGTIETGMSLFWLYTQMKREENTLHVGSTNYKLYPTVLRQNKVIISSIYPPCLVV